MPPTKKKTSVKETRFIKLLYLYVVTGISIVMLLMSATGVLNLVISKYILQVDHYELYDYEWRCTDRGQQPVLEGAELEACLADEREKAKVRAANSEKRELATWLSMLLVAVPVYLYHWGLIKRDK